MPTARLLAAMSPALSASIEILIGPIFACHSTWIISMSAFIVDAANRLKLSRVPASLALEPALLHDSTAARVGALFQLLVQDTTAQDFGLPSSAIRLRM